MIWTLLIIFQFKHLLADYFLQGRYMLGKFKPGWDFIGPLSAHCSVHAIFTFIITMCFCDCLVLPVIAVLLALLDFSIHFTMDRVKASPKLLGRFKPLTGYQYVSYSKRPDLMSFDENTQGYRQHSEMLKDNTYFWWSLGFDQMVHHLTHYWLIYLILAINATSGQWGAL